MSLVGGGFLIPFVQAKVDGRSVHLWPNPLFLVPLACLIVGVVAVVMGVALKDEPKTEPASAHTLGPPRAEPIPFQAPADAELEIYLDREEFHLFRYQAILLEAKVTIQNTTDKTKYTKGPQWNIDPPMDGQFSDFYDIEAMRRLDDLRNKRTPLISTVAPRDSVEGWIHVALPHQAWGGVGGFTITLEDEIGTQYVLRRERRGGRDPLNP